MQPPSWRRGMGLEFTAACVQNRIMLLMSARSSLSSTLVLQPGLSLQRSRFPTAELKITLALPPLRDRYVTHGIAENVHIPLSAPTVTCVPRVKSNIRPRTALPPQLRAFSVGHQYNALTLKRAGRRRLGHHRLSAASCLTNHLLNQPTAGLSP